MKLKTKIRNIEKRQRENEIAWLESLTDAELDKIAGERDLIVSEWLKTLTDDELLILRDGRPGANKLMDKFNEYQKQNQTA